MITETIRLDGSGQGVEKALNLVEREAFDYALDDKTSRQLRLLAEETLEMIRSMTQDYEAKFFLDITRERCEIRPACTPAAHELKSDSAFVFRGIIPCTEQCTADAHDRCAAPDCRCIVTGHAH